MAGRFLKLDYLGVALSITVTNISTTWAGMRHNEPRVMTIVIGVCAICAGAVVQALQGPQTDGTAAALFRVVTFAALMCCGTLGIAYTSLMVGMDGTHCFPLRHIIVTCVCYAAGAAIYVGRIPEKKFPRKFDILVSASEEASVPH